MGLGVTMRRAVCGYDIKPDIAFWTSLWRHYGCADDSEVAKAIRRAWSDGVTAKVKAEFETLRRAEPDYAARLCKNGNVHPLPGPKRFDTADLPESVLP